LYSRLLFVEFLEFIGRIATVVYKMDSTSLKEKICLVLDDVLKTANFVRKAPMMKTDIESESDYD